MARGLKKHLKRLNAPRHWMLDKLGGAFAPKPSSGPHKSRECLPLILILRNRLKYALTYREVIAILMQRHVMVDGKVRTDKTYPAGFMDVVSIPKTNEDFRLLYDTKGRFRLHAITGDETKFKLCKVRSVQFGQKGIPYLNTYDGRTIRYPDPLIKANDTIKLDLESNKIVDFIKFDVGNVVMVTGGRNRGRVGVIKNREKHKGSFETIHVQDAAGHEFATRLGNVFTIGKGTKPWVSLPKGKGIKLSIIEEARKRLAAQASGYAPSNSDRREGALRRKRVEYLDCVAQFYDIPDTERTVPDVAFFQQAQVQKSLARILYTWAIRHPASRYVQGINDLVTPFLVVFLSEYLKGSIDNHYTFAQPGIQRLVFKPKELVRRIDEPVSRHMEDQGLEYLQFAFRWFNCLLIREFSFNGEHSSFLCAELSSLTAFLQPQGDAALKLDKTGKTLIDECFVVYVSVVR
ncbi:hypothetical protein V6N11_037794 [Hibiscus sabdariffa]|uniref:Rab-GAP TBC domain-containing protein n=1 Tax=Hibiscus sabdariffa TaxID=183260 RepID=A0ABR2NAL7_9ROSI